MKSLFLRMFLWFCGAAALVVCVIATGYVVSNPGQLLFAWPGIGRGAIVSAGRVAAETYERGGRVELDEYLASLAHDTGLYGALFDSSGHELGGSGFAPGPPPDLNAQTENRLLLRKWSRVAGVHVRTRGSIAYTFVTSVPQRHGTGVWTRWFIFVLVLTGSLLCYLLARRLRICAP